MIMVYLWNHGRNFRCSYHWRWSYRAGLRTGSEKAGLHYLILEKGVLVNSLYYYPANMTFFPSSIKIGDVPFVSNNVKPPGPKRLNIIEDCRFAKLNIHLQER
jgi:thioredoxin reductase (NADPH)